MGFDLLTCDGERVVEMYLVMPGFGRWLLGLASALCILDRRLAGGSGVNPGKPWGPQYHGWSSVLTECQIPDWHPAISGFRKAGNIPNLNIYSKTVIQ